MFFALFTIVQFNKAFMIYDKEKVCKNQQTVSKTTIVLSHTHRLPCNAVTMQHCLSQPRQRAPVGRKK